MQNLIIYKINFLFVIGKKPCFYSSEKLDIKQLHIKNFLNKILTKFLQINVFLREWIANLN